MGVELSKWDSEPEENLLLSLIPHVGPALAQYRRDVKSRRVEEFLAELQNYLAEQTITLEDFLLSIPESEQLSDLFELAVEAASRTRLEEKIKLLAKAMAQAGTDDARLDESELLIQTLANMDIPHIRVLKKITPVPTTPYVLENWGTGAVQGILGTLEGQGLIRRSMKNAIDRAVEHAMSGERGGAFSHEFNKWERTSYGELLLEWLGQFSPEAESAE